MKHTSEQSASTISTLLRVNSFVYDSQNNWLPKWWTGWALEGGSLCKGSFVVTMSNELSQNLLILLLNIRLKMIMVWNRSILHWCYFVLVMAWFILLIVASSLPISKSVTEKDDKDIDAENYAVLERLKSNQRRDYLKVKYCLFSSCFVINIHLVFLSTS